MVGNIFKIEYTIRKIFEHIVLDTLIKEKQPRHNCDFKFKTVLKIQVYASLESYPGCTHVSAYVSSHEVLKGPERARPRNEADIVRTRCRMGHLKHNDNMFILGSNLTGRGCVYRYS